MKAVSPMIAAVLLIAFTVAVGGVLSFWLTTLTGSTTGNVEAQTSNITKCAGASIQINRVDSSRIIFSNPSSQEISSVILIADKGGGTITPSDQILSPGEIGTVSWTRGTNTSVLARGFCLQSVSVAGSCSAGEACWTS
jgi:flagellin-like protein